jgi:nucleoside-diphosphate-sugar epimerase
LANGRRKQRFRSYQQNLRPQDHAPTQLVLFAMPPLITPADRIFVAGHRGMAGSAICRALQRAGYNNLLTASRTDLDLEDGLAVQRWFEQHQPTVVVLAAAKVGGQGGRHPGQQHLSR